MMDWGEDILILLFRPPGGQTGSSKWPFDT